MKGYVKMIIAGAVIVGIGIAVLLIAGGISGWSFRYDGGDFEAKTYTAEKENLNLDVEFSVGELEIKFYDKDKITVDYHENNKYTVNISEENGTLKFTTGRKHWYDYMFNWNVKFPTTVIWLPQSFRASISLELNAGTVTVADGQFTNAKFEVNAGKLETGNIDASALECRVNAGNLAIGSAVCPRSILEINAGNLDIRKLFCGDITAEINAGTMDLSLTGTEEEYAVYVEKNAGSCNVKSHFGTTEKRLNAEINAGNLKVTFGN